MLFGGQHSGLSRETSTGEGVPGSICGAKITTREWTRWGYNRHRWEFGLAAKILPVAISDANRGTADMLKLGQNRAVDPLRRYGSGNFRAAN